MAVLITGLGYIGVPLAHRLLARGDAVVGLENGFSTVPSALKALRAYSSFTPVRGSVASPRSIDRAFNIDTIETVYHLAAQASAHPEAASVSYTEATNLIGPRLMFEAAARHGVSRFVYGSSFRLYGDDLAGTINEATPYGYVGDLAHLTKLYAEKLLEMLARQHAVPTSNVRLGIVYGVGPLMKVDQRFLTAPNLFCLRAAIGLPLTVRQGANRPMGFIHLDDAVESLLVAARAHDEPVARAYNAVSEGLSVGQVAEIVAKEGSSRGLRVQIEGGRPITGECWRVTSELDACGFRARRTMADAIPEVLDYYLSALGPIDPAGS